MARHANLTNDKAVRALQWREGDPTQFMVKDRDRPGFYIRVSKGGTRAWLYQYRHNGKLERLALGKYPGVSCADAFQRYDQARMAVQAGRDPAEEARQAKADIDAQELADSLTVSRLFHDHYLPRYAMPRKRTWGNDLRYFATKIEPVLGNKPAADVRRADVERLLRPMEQEHYTTARLTLAVLRKMYNWAAEYASAEHAGEGPLLDVANPCRSYRLGPAPSPPLRTLSHAEIRALWVALGDSYADRIIKLQLLTGCRVSEVAGIRWSELDIEAGEWVLPSERSKNGRPLVVPLTSWMEQLIGKRDDESAFVFAAESALGHTTNTGVLQALKRHCQALAIQGVGTHTLRKTFITQMARMGVSRELRDRLTNHVDPSVDARHYNAHDYLAEKRDALGRWERELEALLRDS